MRFGEWLKANRKKQGFTQEGLAKAANDICTGGYISSLERKQDVGKRGQPTKPNEDIVEALADALGRPRDEARLAAGYAPIDQNNLGSDVPTLQFSKERLARLFRNYEVLPEEERQQVDPYLETIETDLERRAQRRKKN